MPRCDATHINLHSLVTGAKSAEEYAKVLCGSDALYSKIHAAALRLEATDPKCVKIQRNLMSPSDFAKSIPNLPHLNDNSFSSNLHVGLQIKAFVQFIDIACRSEESEDTYYEVAGSLMQAMSGYYDFERGRQTDFSKLKRYFLDPSVLERIVPILIARCQ